MQTPRLLRITTVAQSLHLLLNGQFQFMREHGFEVCVASAPGTEVAEISKEGVTHVAISFTRQVTPVRDLLCLIQLIVLLRRFRPHIVHTHTPKAGVLGMIAAWICRVPIRMHTVAGLPYMEARGGRRFLLRITERITYTCAHQIYPNSKALGEFLQGELGFDKSKMKVLGDGSSNGINTVYFRRTQLLEMQAKSIREKHHIQSDEVTFSFVGRIVRDKGIVELVEAFDRIGKLHPVRLIMVGSFEEELDPLPKDTMNFLRTDPRVLLAGFQVDVRPWLLASDVFLLPSYREGFPNVVMQASCLEVPCIVSDINGCNEIIQHNQTGLVVKPKNAKSLLEAMTMLMEPELRSKFGRNAREFVNRHFDQSYIWGELIKEYQTRLDKACIS